MNKTIAIVSAAAALSASLGFAGLAVAQTADIAPDPNRPWTLPAEAAPSRGDRIPLGEIEAQLRAEGLDVREIEWDDGKVEVEARDQNGRWWDIDLDAYTGEVIRSEQDDD